MAEGDFDLNMNDQTFKANLDSWMSDYKADIASIVG
jgi:hypothetical protein